MVLLAIMTTSDLGVLRSLLDTSSLFTIPTKKEHSKYNEILREIQDILPTKDVLSPPEES